MPRPARHAPRPRPLAALGHQPASEALLSLRYRRSARPFGARAPWPIASLKATSLARDALFELREALEAELGERLTQPEVLDLVVEFVVRDAQSLVDEVRAARSAS